MDYEEKELEQHLQALTSAIQHTYGTTKALLWRSFLAGLLSGLGATIGVAIVLALIAYLVRHFGGLPVIGNWLSELGRVLPAKR
ncbi:MAG TPA: DUF5665 domain-containing protein [Candidatus Saccharimonadales bacterium]|nr:DUF5665 domain-containing protein [Candidatus Saccharimonadales bacterium]